MADDIDPLIKSTSSRLYSLAIYMDQGYFYYTRTYKKIFPIISDVFPILNLLLYLFKNITRGVKLTLAKKRTTEILFENIPNHQKNNINYKKKFFNEQFRNIKKDVINKKYSYENKNNNKFDEINNNSNDNNNSNNNNLNNKFICDTELKKNNKNLFPKELNNNAEKISSFLLLNKIENDPNKSNTNDISLHGLLNKNKNQFKRKKTIFINKGNFFPLDLSKFDNQNNVIKEKLKETEKKNLFPLYYFFLDIFIDKLVKPKTFCYIDKKYLIVYNFMGQIFDISSHIQLIKNFNILQNIFFDEINGGKQYFYEKKININNEYLMNEINKDLSKNTCDIFTKALLN
jgi:hypothetical protein